MVIIGYIFMIDDSIIEKFAAKYEDEQFVWGDQEIHKKRMLEDPDYAAKINSEMADRQMKQRQKIRSNPDLDVSKRYYERERQHAEALRAERNSGTLDGFALKLKQQIADLNKNLKSKILRMRIDPATHPALKQEVEKFNQDRGELYYLRDKLKEFAQTLRPSDPGMPLVPTNIDHVLLIDDLCKDYLVRFKRYGAICTTIQSVRDKLKEIAGGLVGSTSA